MFIIIALNPFEILEGFRRNVLFCLLFFELVHLTGSGVLLQSFENVFQNSFLILREDFCFFDILQANSLSKHLNDLCEDG